jgi:hypothetical protein
LKATIKLHCIRVKEKEAVGVQSSEVQGSGPFIVSFKVAVRWWRKWEFGMQRDKGKRLKAKGKRAKESGRSCKVYGIGCKAQGKTELSW